jgi:sodium-dependent phosphate cotransporter
LLTFFIVPFSLIYFNQDVQPTLKLTYEVREGTSVSYKQVVSRIDSKTGAGDWSLFSGLEPTSQKSPMAIFPVQAGETSILIGKDRYLFTKRDSCWSGENDIGKYTTCVKAKTDTFKIDNTKFKSVYIFEMRHPGSNSKNRVFLDADQLILIRLEHLNASDSVTRTEMLMTIDR